ncbi:MAG: hypothetical protein RLN62_07200 [Rickettsiales bacterium]
MDKNLLESSLDRIHKRYEFKLDSKDISFFTIADEEIEKIMDNNLLDVIEMVHESILFLLTNVCPDGTDIHHSIEFDKKNSRLNITFLSNAYLSLIFDKNDKYSVKKSGIINEYFEFLFKSLCKEIDKFGGEYEHYPSDKFMALNVIRVYLPLTNKYEDKNVRKNFS